MASSITWRELVSQPARWRKLAIRAPAPSALWEDVQTAEQVVVFGSGSSYYLAALVGDTIERITGRRVLALPSCEVMLDPDRTLPPIAGQRLAIGFSRSGESSEVLLAAGIMRERGIPVLGVTCTAGSSLSRDASECLVVPEGHEDGMVMLRSFTCMALACRMALGPRAIGLTEGDVPGALARMADAGEAVLRNEEGPIAALTTARRFDRFVLLGSGADYPLAQEASLKLQEMATVTTEAYYTLEYRHGPRSTGDAQTLATMFAPAQTDLGVSLVRDLAGQGLATLVIGGDVGAYRGVATAVVSVGTALPEPLCQLLALLPVQLLAFATATRTGQDPDAPRNLAKVVLF